MPPPEILNDHGVRFVPGWLLIDGRTRLKLHPPLSSSRQKTTRHNETFSPGSRSKAPRDCKKFREEIRKRDIEHRKSERTSFKAADEANQAAEVEQNPIPTRRGDLAQAVCGTVCLKQVCETRPW